MSGREREGWEFCSDSIKLVELVNQTTQDETNMKFVSVNFCGASFNQMKLYLFRSYP
jgi:hypothetical protein